MKSLSRAWLFVAPGTVAWTKLFRPWDFLGKCTGVGCCFLLQGIFPTQGSNPGLSHYRQMLYHLSHQGSKVTLAMSNSVWPHGLYMPGSSVQGILQARILEWVAMPSSRGSSQTRDRTCVLYVSCIGQWVLYHLIHLGSPRWVQSSFF